MFSVYYGKGDLAAHVFYPCYSRCSQLTLKAAIVLHKHISVQIQLS